MPATQQNGDRDPSMEEILSSIRHIISTEGDAGEGLTPEPSTRPSDAAGGAADADDPASGDPAVFGDDMTEPAAAASTGDATPDPAPEPTEHVDPGGKAEPDFGSGSRNGETLAGEPEPFDTARSGLVSGPAEAASLDALSELQAAMAIGPESASVSASAGGSGRTVEQIAAELMQPMLKEMLKEWLDANLPEMVRNVVEDEVRRLSTRLRR